jgi:hypothetical protein
MSRRFKRVDEPQVVTEPKNEEATEKKEIKSDIVEIIPQSEPVIEVQPIEPEITVGDEKSEGLEYAKDWDEKDFPNAITLEEHHEPCVCEEPCTEPCVCEEKVVVEAPAQRPFESLSPAQLKAYQRTGYLPK